MGRQARGFGLSLHEEITGGYVGGKHGPSGPDLEYARDLARIHSEFPGYMGPDCVVVVGLSRSFGVQPDENTEVHSEWGAYRRLSLAMRGLLLLTLLLMVSGLVGKGVVCSRRRGRDDAVGRRRSRFGVSERLIPGV
jgi:hypothetical protein